MADELTFLEECGAEFSAVEASANPHLDADSEADDTRHWLCAFEGGPVGRFEFHLTLDARPDAATAFTLLMEDVRSFRECEGYEDFARLLGLDDGDASGRGAFDEIARLAPHAEALEAAARQAPSPTP